MKYKIYAGLGGGFGGADYQETIEAENKEAAIRYAEESAKEIYLSYGGLHGLLDYDTEMEDNPELTQEDYEGLEEDDFQSWAEYHVEEVKE